MPIVKLNLIGILMRKTKEDYANEYCNLKIQQSVHTISEAAIGIMKHAHMAGQDVGSDKLNISEITLLGICRKASQSTGLKNIAVVTDLVYEFKNFIRDNHKSSRIINYIHIQPFNQEICCGIELDSYIVLGNRINGQILSDLEDMLQSRIR
jgi:hypothetical protein